MGFPFASPVPETGSVRQARALWCVVSAAILQVGLLQYLPTQQSTVWWMIGAVLLSLATGSWAVFAPAGRLRGTPRPLLWALFIACLTSLPFRPKLLITLLGGHPPEWLAPALVGLAIVGAVAAAWRGGRRGRQAVLLLLAALFVYRCRYAIRAVEDTSFDVIYFHHEASRHLLQGQSPYAPPMPVYVSPEAARLIYPPSLLSGNQLQAGYVYPPVILLMGLPSFLLTGDVRYSGILAILVVAFLCTRFSRSQEGWLLAAVILTNPYTVLVVSLGWVEQGGALLMSLFLFVWQRWPARAGWLFGLVVASKQTMVVWIPFGAWLLFRRFPGWRERWNWIGQVSVTALGPLLAFLYWSSPRDMYNSMVRFFVIYPLRDDSISLGTVLATAAPAMLWAVPVLTLGLWGLVLTLAVRRGLYRILGLWLAACTLAWTAFLIVNKQALPNYYFLSVLLWLIGAALLASGESGDNEGETMRGVPETH